ncbi:hypothetical protein B0G69_5546 [Paraburkholderia sp. RAU2J]|nr:hypothetical protein B0G69_5546 [Paraburkholderia sp. RAU2J]
MMKSKSLYHGHRFPAAKIRRPLSEQSTSLALRRLTTAKLTAPPSALPISSRSAHGVVKHSSSAAVHEQSQTELIARAQAQFHGSSEESLTLAEDYDTLAPRLRGWFLETLGLSRRFGIFARSSFSRSCRSARHSGPPNATESSRWLHIEPLPATHAPINYQRQNARFLSSDVDGEQRIVRF